MRTLGLFLAAFAAILIFTGCESTGGYRVTLESPPPPPRTVVIHEEVHRHGPPPHAPAHGYRHKHQGGYDLVFDRNTGCYTVVGYRDYYYSDGLFFRFGGDGWQVSARVGGTDARWEHADEYRLPGGLRTKYKENRRDRGDDDDENRGKGKGRGNKRSSLDAPLVEPIIEARWGKY